MTDDVRFHNEACATCGLPADVHLSQKDGVRETPHTIWGDTNRCRVFVRCNPPRAAYGALWSTPMPGTC